MFFQRILVQCTAFPCVEVDIAFLLFALAGKSCSVAFSPEGFTQRGKVILITVFVVGGQYLFDGVFFRIGRAVWSSKARAHNRRLFVYGEIEASPQFQRYPIQNGL